jgi:hypothetical protein
MRALAVVDVLPGNEARAALSDLGDAADLDPLADFESAHVAGLNFSRSWGLLALHRLTGDLAFRDAFLAHWESHYARPEYWRDDYAQHSHWIPQFGLLGLFMADR